MATFTANRSIAFDFLNVNLNWYQANFHDANVLKDVSAAINGVIYQDVVTVHGIEGVKDLELVVAGSDITGNVISGISGGTITAVAERGYLSAGFNWTAQGINTEASVLFQSVLTSSTFDELSIFSAVLAGNDSIDLSDGADRMFGFAGDDTLVGYAGADHLDGGDGNDVLDGGTGNDTLVGGDGDDHFIVNSAGDVVTEMANQGVDLIDSTVSLSLPDNVEGLIFVSPGNLNVTGNALDNKLSSNAGNNVLDGGAGKDWAAYTFASAGVSVTLGSTTQQNTGSDGLDTLVSIENLSGSLFNDALYGDATDNVIVGAAGADVLVAGGGKDTVFGGADNDYLYLGEDNDVGYGDDGIDVIVAAAGNDVALGGSGQDYLYMGDGDDVLYGDDGVDVLIGEAGNDSGHGGNDGDYFYLGEGDDFAFGDDGNDIFVDPSGNNVAVGGAGQDYFYAGAGNDWMDGGAGVDVMLGDTGNDTFNGGMDVDYLFLGPGGAGDNDTVIVDKDQSGPQVVYGFEVGAPNDVIVLSGTAMHSFSDVQVATTDYTAAGNFRVITLDADTNIWLIGVTPSQLSAADFLFA